MSTKFKIIVAVGYFLVLYFIAFFSVRKYYKDFPHFLFVKDTQWAGILCMYLPLIAVMIGNK